VTISSNVSTQAAVSHAHLSVTYVMIAETGRTKTAVSILYHVLYGTRFCMRQ